MGEVRHPHSLCKDSQCKVDDHLESQDNLNTRNRCHTWNKWNNWDQVFEKCHRDSHKVYTYSMWDRNKSHLDRRQDHISDWK